MTLTFVQVMAFMDLNRDRTLQLLVDNVDRLPVEHVISQLEGNSGYEHLYLDRSLCVHILSLNWVPADPLMQSGPLMQFGTFRTVSPKATGCAVHHSST